MHQLISAFALCQFFNAKRPLTTMQMSSLPDDYVVPSVWEFEGNAKATAGSNRPVAGARQEVELPVGSHPLQLYSLGTPNGQKITIMLEELNDAKEVEYDAWKVDIGKGDQFNSGFVDLNPNSKIPALYDVDLGHRIFESGSILLHLAQKYDAFLPSEPKARAECVSWLFFQVGGGPSMGAFGHFYKVAPVKIEYAIDRFALETKRQLSVLDQHLAKNEYMAGPDYSVADIAIFPWILTVENGYNGKEFLQVNDYENLQRWKSTIAERPAVQRGRRVLGFGDDALSERHSKADFDDE